MSAKMTQMLAMIAAVAVLLFIVINVAKMPSQPPKWVGKSAMLPCLSNSQCPMGQTCNNGVCAEGFSNSAANATVAQSTDMSSCGAKECNGVNAPCARTATPCAEGTFCQNNSCVSIAAPSQGEAYNQIGMLLSQ